jgi:hypothetical protein
MAQAFPKSRFYGFDYHDKSVEGARESAKRAGVADLVTFEVAAAKGYPGKDYDFVAVFDCLHDMGDPVGAAKHVRESLAKDGTWMIVEPFANDDLKDNLNPVGRVYYSFSTLLCTPCSRSQEVGLCLGAQAGEAGMREVVNSARFGRFRRATETKRPSISFTKLGPERARFLNKKAQTDQAVVGSVAGSVLSKVRTRNAANNAAP